MAEIVTPQKEIERLALVFSGLIAAEFSADVLAEIKRKNATPDYQAGACATHDYCDANMFMEAAFNYAYRRPPELESESDLDLWNEAWHFAHREFLSEKAA